MKKLSIALMTLLLLACQEGNSTSPGSTSGVKQVKVKIETGADGVTTEQRNVANRLLIDNKPGSIKHLYVISAYSGQTIIYSTVKGKVTSSGKRLAPTTVLAANGNSAASTKGIPVAIGNYQFKTGEVLQDDGTYGSSIPYVFWWDTKGIYHQHYVSGGQILHVADQPINVGKVIINMEVTKEP